MWVMWVVRVAVQLSSSGAPTKPALLGAQREDRVAAARAQQTFTNSAVDRAWLISAVLCLRYGLPE